MSGTTNLVMSQNATCKQPRLSPPRVCFVVTQKMVTSRTLGVACRTAAATAATCLRSYPLERQAGRSQLHPWPGLRCPTEELEDQGHERPGRWARPARRHWLPVCRWLPTTLGMVGWNVTLSLALDSVCVIKICRHASFCCPETFLYSRVAIWSLDTILLLLLMCIHITPLQGNLPRSSWFNHG